MRNPFRKKKIIKVRMAFVEWKNHQMVCDIAPEEFDRYLNADFDKDMIVPVIDGEEIGYLSTPAYAIVLRKVKK